MTEGDLLTPREAMHVLNVSKSLIYKLCDEGTLPSVRIASAGSRRGALRIWRRDLEEFVARLRGDAPKRQPAMIDVDQILARVRRTAHG